MIYGKQALTIADQVALLQVRGLQVADPVRAAKLLETISYYRLAGYWWPMQDDRVNHSFKPGSQFDTVISLYNFDRELRLLMFDIIERIEIALRTRLIYVFSMAHSPWWFEDPTLFRNLGSHNHNLLKIDDELNRSKDPFILDHFARYTSDTRRPPAWKTMEVLSLGLLSRLYGNLLPSVAATDQIAQRFLVFNKTYLHPWLQCITEVRNVCAHHSRLWNRNLTTVPRLLPRPPAHFFVAAPTQPKKLYTALIGMKYLLYSIDPTAPMTQRLRTLLAQYPEVDPAAIGFPRNWHQEPLWQS